MTILQQYVDDFLEVKEAAWTDKTAENYTNLLARFVAYCGDNWPVSAAAVVKFLTTGERKEKLSPVSVWSSFGHIKTFYNYLMFRGIIEPRQNVAKEIMHLRLLPKKPRRAYKGMPDEDVSTLLAHLTEQAAADDPYLAARDLAMIHFAAVTGARSGELCNLEVDHLSLKRGEAIIPADHSKTGAERVIYFTPEVAETLGGWLALWPEIGYLGPWVFPSFYYNQPRDKRLPRRKKLTIWGTYQAFRSRLAEAKLPDYSLHSLRHSAALKAIDGGVSLNHIRDQLGHENLKTTEGYLVGRDKDRKRAWQEVSYS